MMFGAFGLADLLVLAVLPQALGTIIVDVWRDQRLISMERVNINHVIMEQVSNIKLVLMVLGLDHGVLVYLAEQIGEFGTSMIV
jgi:hypothetical protein